jgi:hypothetical protein
MNPIQSAILMSIFVFLGVAGCAELGFRLGRRALARHPDLELDNSPAIDAAVFALLGLLLAFAFGSAVSRLDTRRQLITQETNAVSTAYLRLDFLPASGQPAMRALFRDYVDARLGAFRDMGSATLYQQHLLRGTELQGEIWQRAAAYVPADGAQDTMVSLMESLNAMFDVATARTLATEAHLPTLITVLLIGVALLSGLVAGRSMARHARRSPFHTYIYAAAIAISLYAIIDLDHPRHGLIRVDAADHALIELRDSIPPPPAARQ